MLELNYALNLIIKGLESTTNALGFALEYPENRENGAVQKNGGKTFVMYRGEKGRIKMEFENNKLALYCATAEEAETPDDGMTRASLSLLELEEYDERDLKYIFDDFTETINTMFSSKRELRGKSKLPPPVSKSQAKSGALAYDANTLANRLTSSVCPELRDAYKENIDTYGEFLAEEFFVKHGNKSIMAIIRENDDTKMRRLFKLLGEIYEDGTNDTQSLVAVTILGCIADEPELLDKAAPYFTETMEEPVTEVIRYLSSKGSKSARMRLENPPLYKPKKKKKKGGIQSMLGM